MQPLHPVSPHLPGLLSLSSDPSLGGSLISVRGLSSPPASGLLVTPASIPLSAVSGSAHSSLGSHRDNTTPTPAPTLGDPEHQHSSGHPVKISRYSPPALSPGHRVPSDPWHLSATLSFLPFPCHQWPWLSLSQQLTPTVRRESGLEPAASQVIIR